MSTLQQVAAYFNPSFQSQLGSLQKAQDTIKAIVREAGVYFAKYFGSPQNIQQFGTDLDIEVFGSKN